MEKIKKVLQGIDTVIVRVSDINRSKQWYQEKLELMLVWDDPAINLAVLDTGSPTSLTLWQTDKEIRNSRETASYPIFRTQDAKLAHQEFQDKGVEVGEVIADGAVKYFFFYDLDRNVLEACQVHN
ncbi:catechol 2,3-dioxygenase-like lactoylglutathione lyase family enzyme [Pontibacter ummariensis]|uniref:Catechol 2,3-dioxygenase n=1 Tax=Pontibacter ummariensis TaxID=1610492 RepID=A0A239CP90_9BACT|nr:VOC family protein [Pontibacter ummariensis]PRY14902.1 catechol 2,3-dioxygenase-like lactoylglutathione lyase family enzyme [Pontibacter ummariensis]SNS21960.1 Catechol 2,3-dioxygenase [Pontibacter ummariensis]